MKRLMKKTISIVCAVALLFTGLAFVPQTVSADDVWYTMDNTWPEPHPLLQVPEGETSLWTGCTGPGTEIQCANAFMLEGFKWNTVNPSGEAAFFKTIDLKDVACVDNGSGLEKPVAGTYYNMHVKLTYIPPNATNYPKMKVETSGGIKNLELTQWDYKHSKLHPEEDVLEHEIDGVVCMKPGEDFKFCINYGWLSDSDKSYMKKGVFEITEFTLTGDESWKTVPNQEPTFTDGPWNMFGNFDPAHEGNWGILQYKTNTETPTSYSDYTFRPVSVSGWLAWACFARLENYLSDYYDPGDPYDITLTINSTKATVPTAKEDDLDQLLVVVGADLHYYDLQAGVNTIHITGDNYNLNSSEPHEQIMLEMDGLQAGTELTVQNIQITGPNDGWTNVPNKKDTKVGDWTLFGWWNETHWSKLAYKNHTGGTGLGAIDIKARRVSGDFGAMAALAMLPNYLATAKDTKDRPIANSDDYQIKVTMNASGLDSSVTDYGRVRLLANDQAFDFDIQKGTKTYDLLELCGNKMTYDNTKTNDVEFELDKVSPKAILNISKIEFVGPDDESQDVPNGTAFKPEGTPWTLFAITDPDQDKYGAMRYEVTGDPANLSNLKMTLKSVSGWFGAGSIKATLNGYLNSLTVGKTYKLTVKMNIDESGVAPADKNPPYNKQLRITADNKNYDFDVANPATGVQTFEKEFTYTGTSKHLAFDFDQLLKGSKVSFSSIEITDPTAPTTTEEPTTQAPTQPTTEAPTGETTQSPTAETSSQQPSDVTTTQGVAPTVKAPGKAKIKKVYKKKRSAKKLKVKLKKVKGAKGYQVAVYKSKKKAKKNKKALVKKYTKKLKVTLKSKKLKKKKKLYVRARAYVLDAKGIKVFGKWSAIKKGKTKK